MPTPNGQEVNKIVCRLSKPNWNTTAQFPNDDGSLPIPTTVGGAHQRVRFWNATYPPAANLVPAWTIAPGTQLTGDRYGRWIRRSPAATVLPEQLTGARAYAAFYSVGQANDSLGAPSPAVESQRLGANVSLSFVPYADNPVSVAPFDPNAAAGVTQQNSYLYSFRVRAVVSRLVATASFTETNVVGGLYVQRQHSIEV